MTELTQWLKDNIQDNRLEWKVLHKIKDDNVNVAPWEIIMIERGIGDRDLPFTFSQGYFSLKGDDRDKEIDDLLSAIKEVAEHFANDHNALCNLYIFVLRISAHREDDLPGEFLNLLNKEQLVSLMAAYIDKLNRLFENSRLKQNKPNTAWEWAMMFTSAQYMDSFNDPLAAFNIITAKLSGDARETELKWLLKLSPLARSRAVDFWGVNIKASSAEIIAAIIEDSSEAAFISAYLSELLPHENLPDWLNKEIIEILFIKHWGTAGCFLLQSTYGMSFRVQNEQLGKVIKPLFNEVLQDYFIKGTIGEDKKILQEMLWPRDFISLANWLHDEKIALSTIHTRFNDDLPASVVKVLSDFLKGVPNVLSSGNVSSGVEFYSLNNVRYTLVFPYLLLILIKNKKSTEQFKKCFMGIKQLYFGEWEAQHIAEDYAEFVLLMLTSVHQINDLEKEHLYNYNNLLDDFIKMLWYSYIQKAEKDEYIWNKDYAFGVSQSNFPKYFLNRSIKILSTKAEYKVQYSKLYDSFLQYKTATWPFERMDDINAEE